MNEDKATRYHRLKRRADLLSLGWTVLLLVALIATGLSVTLGNAVQTAVASAMPAAWSAIAVVVYAVCLVLLNEVGGLPVAYYSGFVLERRYGLSNDSFRGWLKDQAKSLVIRILVGGIAATTVYACIRLWPAQWWWIAGVIFALVIVGLTNLAPILLLPLFYELKPLERETLRNRLLALADRAGARVLGAYQWGLAERTRKANAALAGLGSTRRILVSDTMLAAYSDDEIEIVLAHELAHHVHGDIWKGLVLESALVMIGFYAAARVLDASVGPLGLGGPSDVAGLPVLLLALGTVSLVALPAAHAMSRGHERRADRYALELTGNPRAFISAMRRLGAQNLAEEYPSMLVQWLFYSHPPMRERMAAAQAFRKGAANERLLARRSGVSS